VANVAKLSMTQARRLHGANFFATFTGRATSCLGPNRLYDGGSVSSTTCGDGMTVAKWEFWSVAVMLAESHGLEAEAVAAEKLQDAIERGHSGDILTWREIAQRLPEILAKRYPPPT